MDETRWGAGVRGEWRLDPAWVTVNHGSYGATPLTVLAAQDEWRRRMEAQPTAFMTRVLPEALRGAAATLAGAIGAAADDVVFVENATVGCNAVLRSLSLAPGDEVLVLGHVYGAVRNTVRHTVEQAGACLVEARIPFPALTADALAERVAGALSARTRLAVLDHITSSSALLLPVARLAALCRAAGVPVLIDGAHAPGHVALDVTATGADFYVGNCHKWLMAPKGAGFLWAAADRQERLHPVTISHGYGMGLAAEFDWTGTRDPSAFLAVPDALAFHARMGGAALMARNVALAQEGARTMARRLNTTTGPDGDFACAMALVRLPAVVGSTPADAAALRARLLEARCDAPMHALDGALWLRLSAQAYNEPADFVAATERVAEILR